MSDEQLSPEQRELLDEFDQRFPRLVSRCLAHLEDEPCQTCAAYIAAGL